MLPDSATSSDVRQRTRPATASAGDARGKSGCALRGAAARRPDRRRSRGKKKPSRYSIVACSASLRAYERQNFASASAPIRSASGAAAPASAGSRRATRRARSARSRAPPAVIDRGAARRLTERAAGGIMTAPPDSRGSRARDVRQGRRCDDPCQRDEAANRHDELRWPRVAHAAPTMPIAGISRAFSATLNDERGGADDGVGAVAVPADQLMRQRVVQRHQRKRERAGSETPAPRRRSRLP